MDGSKFWCFPWFPENSLLCVILRYTVYIHTRIKGFSAGFQWHHHISPYLGVIAKKLPLVSPQIWVSIWSLSCHKGTSPVRATKESDIMSLLKRYCIYSLIFRILVCLFDLGFSFFGRLVFIHFFEEIGDTKMAESEISKNAVTF